jgi:hypothetical protein
VRDLGIHADHLGMLQRGDEAEHRAGRRQVDVAPRLVRLGLEREAELIAAVDAEARQPVQGIAEALQREQRILAGLGLDTLAPTPEHVGRGAELDAELDRARRLLQGEGAHAGVVAREGAVLEDRIAEEIGRRHRHDDPVVAQRLLELGDDRVALLRTGVDRHEVLVVEIDAVGAHLGEQLDDLGRGEHRAHGCAEGITARIADGPETETELVRGARIEGTGVGLGGHRDAGRGG